MTKKTKIPIKKSVKNRRRKISGGKLPPLKILSRRVSGIISTSSTNSLKFLSKTTINTTSELFSAIKTFGGIHAASTAATLFRCFNKEQLDDTEVMNFYYRLKSFFELTSLAIVSPLYVFSGVSAFALHYISKVIDRIPTQNGYSFYGITANDLTVSYSPTVNFNELLEQLLKDGIITVSKNTIEINDRGAFEEATAKYYSNIAEIQSDVIKAGANIYVKVYLLSKLNSKYKPIYALQLNNYTIPVVIETREIASGKITKKQSDGTYKVKQTLNEMTLAEVSDKVPESVLTTISEESHEPSIPNEFTIVDTGNLPEEEEVSSTIPNGVENVFLEQYDKCGKRLVNAVDREIRLGGKKRKTKRKRKSIIRINLRSQKRT